ncbi:hypothetical protein L6452_27858 [Arctium lappa]|nr:hypothetical protein L6452_27858 [Arctium lappa]
MQLSQSAGRSRIQGLFAGRFSCEVLTSQSRLGQYSEAYRFRWSECTSCFVWTGANFADCWEDFTVRVGTQTTRLTSGQRFFVLSEKEFEIREGRPATTSGIVGNGALGSVLPAVVLSMLLLLGRALTESESCASTLYYSRVGSQSPTILTWGRIGRRGLSCFTLTLSLTWLDCFEQPSFLGVPGYKFSPNGSTESGPSINNIFDVLITFDKSQLITLPRKGTSSLLTSSPVAPFPEAGVTQAKGYDDNRAESSVVDSYGVHEIFLQGRKAQWHPFSETKKNISQTPFSLNREVDQA